MDIIYLYSSPPNGWH